MSDCQSVDRLVTPYVDGELSPDDRTPIDAHLRACGPCRARVAVERSMHDIVAARRAALQGTPAPVDLRSRCALLGCTPAAGSLRWRSRAFPLAIAATLVLLVAAAVLNQLTQTSVRVMAAELAMDHVTCDMVNAMLGTRHDHADVERALAASFSWNAALPDQPEQAGLELVGARTCLYGQGRVAHIMYRYEGRPVSLFMLPEAERSDHVVEVMGHRETVWSSDGRTFVLVAGEPEAEMQRIASFMRTTLR